MIYIINISLWVLAGMCSGVMDSIQFHDSYKKWGYFWSRDSWQMQKWLWSFAPNAWHFAKYVMVCCFLIIGMLGITGAWMVIGCIFAFMAGFNISYK